MEVNRLIARQAVLFRGLLAAAVAIGISGCGGTSTNEPTKTTDQKVQLVTLESAQTPGTSPWMDSVTSPGVPNRVPRVETASTTRTLAGDQVGLYGGSANLVVCDRGKMVRFLNRISPRGGLQCHRRRERW
jgi:hypothetical protein